MTDLRRIEILNHIKAIRAKGGIVNVETLSALTGIRKNQIFRNLAMLEGQGIISRDGKCEWVHVRILREPTAEETLPMKHPAHGRKPRRRGRNSEDGFSLTPLTNDQLEANMQAVVAAAKKNGTLGYSRDVFSADRLHVGRAVKKW